MKESYDFETADFMDIAFEEACSAALEGEIPVGAVIVKEGKVLARAGNSSRRAGNPTRHAEINAIEQAAELLKNERLTDCDIYITKEPCAMCAGAIVHARIRHVFIGAEDLRFGACGTVLSVCGNTLLNHVPQITFGIQREKCSGILSEFFKKKRLEKKSGKELF